MKKLIFGLTVLAIIASGCTKTKPESEDADAVEMSETTDTLQETKILIAYYSLSGNTKIAAEQIQALTGADIFEIEILDPYPADYNATIERARSEREAGYRPELTTKVDNIADYDVIFIGSPNWFNTLSLPVFSFLESHDLSGKVIAPFITHGRGGLQNTITDLKALCPDSIFLEEFVIAGVEIENNKEMISQWLERIGMLNE